MIRPSRPAVLLVILVFIPPLVGLWLHYLSGLHFPYHRNDELRFFFPAMNFYERWTTASPELNASEGIFWMQDGYYIVMGLLSHLFGASIESFRHVSFGFSLVFYFSILGYVCRSHLKNHALIIPVVWFFSPIIVAFSNYARMEALIFAFVGLCLWAISSNRYVIALFLLILTVTIHPVGVALSAFFCLFLLLDFWGLRAAGALKIGWLEVLVIIAAVLAVAGQTIHWLNNVELLLAHMEIQFARKVGRSYLERLSHPGSVFLILSAGAIFLSYFVDRWLGASKDGTNLVNVKVRAILFVALSLSLYGIYGAEVNYAGYIYITSPLLSVLALLELIEYVRAHLPQRSMVERGLSTSSRDD